MVSNWNTKLQTDVPMPRSLCALTNHLRTAANAVNGDFTYGGQIQDVAGSSQVGTLVSSAPVLNAEVIAILMDDTDPNIASGVNTNHVKNPQQQKLLNASMAGDNASPGVGPDYVYLDTWDHPYLITMALNHAQAAKILILKKR